MDARLLRAMRASLSMTKQRCLNPSQRDYHRYGGKGVTFCERWKKFENFLADMGERPPGMTLERVDNSGGYEPGNCVWASRRDQSRNRDLTLKLSYAGVERTISEWAEITGIPYFTLKARHTRLGYSDAECLEKPVKCGSKLPGRVYAARRVSAPGLIRRGLAHPNTKLSLHDACACRARWASGESFSALARVFGVTTTTMSNACRGLGAYTETDTK